MSVTSKLDEVVYNLEKDVNLNRIKKVMICASGGKWETNLEKLQNLSIRDLVQELYWKAQTLENLYQVLDKILAKINKKAEYTLIINTILSQVGKLYIEEHQNDSFISLNQFSDLTHSSKTSSKIVEKSQLKNQEKLHFSPVEIQNLFNVKLKILQHTNPLRVKVLLFSSLEKEFNFSEQDWSKLKLTTLDSLLKKLLQTFQSFPELKSHLHKMAAYLDNPEENIQAARIVIETLSSVYYKQDSSDHQFNSLPNSALTSSLNFMTSTTPSRKTSSKIITQYNLEEFEQFASQYSQQKIQKKITYNLQKSLNSITESVWNLGNFLNQDFPNNADNASQEKYKFLSEFLKELKAKVTEFENDLNQLEFKEREALKNNSQADFTAFSGFLQQQILELAKQGNPKAISHLLNQSLKPRGIQARVQFTEGYLKIVLESPQVPDSKKMVYFVHKKLISLKIKSIKTLKIYGRQSGQKSAAWMQEFHGNKPQG